MNTRACILCPTTAVQVPGEMFTLAMEAKTRGMGVVGSTSNILDFIALKVRAGGAVRGARVMCSVQGRHAVCAWHTVCECGTRSQSGQGEPLSGRACRGCLAAARRAPGLQRLEHLRLNGSRWGCPWLWCLRGQVWGSGCAGGNLGGGSGTWAVGLGTCAVRPGAVAVQGVVWVGAAARGLRGGARLLSGLGQSTRVSALIHTHLYTRRHTHAHMHTCACTDTHMRVDIMRCRSRTPSRAPTGSASSLCWVQSRA